MKLRMLGVLTLMTSVFGGALPGEQPLIDGDVTLARAATSKACVSLCLDNGDH